MALEFNTIGVKLNYVIETTAGTRPTSGVTNIPDIKSIPGFDLTPNQLPVTNLSDDTERFVPGVKSLGGEKTITANHTANLRTKWASLVTAANSAWASGKSTWFEIEIPNEDSFWFAGIPTMEGLADITVDSTIDAQLHIIPNQIVGWAAKHTGT